MIKLLAFVRDGGNLGIRAVRMLWPISLLGQRADFETTYIDGPNVAKLLSSGREDRLKGYDLYILSRLHGPTYGEHPFKKFLENGKIIYETDDDLTCKFRDFGHGEWIQETVNLVDALTVSTVPLGHRMSAVCDKDIYVLPNHVRTDFYHEGSMATARGDPSLTIGLAGTDTHWADWILVTDALKRIKAKYPDVRILCLGYRPKYLEWAEFLSPVPFQYYPRLLRQIDIRLCPLEEDPFNDSKSAISVFEAMAASRFIDKRIGGVVPIVSDHIVFRDAVQHRQTGLVVKDRDWFSAMELLITDAQLRKNLAMRGNRWVKKNRDIRDGVKLWAAAYKRIVGRNDGKRISSAGRKLPARRVKH